MLSYTATVKYTVCSTRPDRGGVCRRYRLRDRQRVTLTGGLFLSGGSVHTTWAGFCRGRGVLALRLSATAGAPVLIYRAKRMSEKMAVMPQEMADQEFERMCEGYRIETDMSGEDEDSVKGFGELRAKICKAFVRGELVLSDEGRPIYTTGQGTRLAFKAFSGAMLLAMDKAKAGDGTRRMYLFLSEITDGGLTPGKLDKRDVNVLFALGSLFLAM